MIIFAFAFFGILIAILNMGFKSANSKVCDYKLQRDFDRRDRLIASIKASRDDIDNSMSSDSFLDIVDDMKYITGDHKLTEEMCKYSFEGNYELWNQTKRWRPVISNIRLAKMGKVNDNAIEPYSIRVVKESETYNGVHRYYEVLAKYYNNIGIPMRVVEEGMCDSNFTFLNLSGFSIRN